MPTIPLKFEDYITSSGRLKTKEIKGLPRVKFLIDTGAPKTLISYKTFLETEMPKSHLEEQDEIHIAGLTVNYCKLKRKTKLKLESTKGEIIDIPLQNYGVMTPIKQERKYINKLLQIPTLVGLDFLKDNNLKLVCNASKRKSYLKTTS